MLQHDLSHALRWFRGNPGFAAAALFVLALGIGAATATFTVIHAVMLRPLPFEPPDRIIRVWSSPPGRNLPFFSVSSADALDWRARATTLSTLAPYDRQRAATLTGGSEPEHIMVARVSRELFELLGVTPAIGRWFAPDEDRTGAVVRVAVIAHGVWQRRFGGRADVLGETLRLDDQSWAVIGVMPRTFAIPNNPAEVWLPLQLAPDPARTGGRYLRVLARLRHGVTAAEATKELERIAADLAREHPASNRMWTVTVRPLMDTVVDESFRRALLIVSGAVGLVLLVACANVASLLLSRATSRAREMAVRTALGASRRTLVRQLLTESLVLATAGGALGVLLAMWGLDALAALAAATIPRADEIALRPAVVLFACAVTMLTAVVFGLAPAFAASRVRAEALHVRDVSGGPGAIRIRDILIVAEVALAIVLLVGAGLMVRSFLHLQQRELGFEPDRLLLVDVAAPGTTPSPIFYETLTARLDALPGVEAVATGSSLPFAGPNSANAIGIEGRVFDAGEQPDGDFRVVSAEYFRVLSIPLVRGRTFATTPSSPSTVINAAAARRFFQSDDPIGRRLRLGSGPWMEVVGVVGDARYLGLDDPHDDVRPMLYIQPAQMPARPQTVVLKTTVPPALLAPAVRTTIGVLAPARSAYSLARSRELKRLHRPSKSFSIRRLTCSQGSRRSVPASMASIRRSISSFQAASASGSAGPSRLARISAASSARVAESKRRASARTALAPFVMLRSYASSVLSDNGATAGADHARSYAEDALFVGRRRRATSQSRCRSCLRRRCDKCALVVGVFSTRTPRSTPGPVATAIRRDRITPARSRRRQARS